MIETKIARYIELSLTIKRHEAELKELRGDILQYVKEVNPEDNEVAIEGAGRFKIERRKKYEFPLAIQEQEDVLEEMKADAIARGEASVEYTEILKYYSGGADTSA